MDTFMNQTIFSPSLTPKKKFLFFIIAFLVRASTWHFFIQPNKYYKQADSMDYHNCALNLALGNGMHRIDTKEPIFWRTPGYPPYLAYFYSHYGVKSGVFEHNQRAQEASIWVQLLLASCIPIILYALAYTITLNEILATILGWIGVFHPGLILASTFLLTEGLALIFFYLFLLFLYRLIFLPQKTAWMWCLLACTASLSIYTWMRPMGEFISYFSALLIFLASHGTWKLRAQKALLFLILFLATLFPWYWRNYQLTGEWFFCPTIGTYLNVFSAPKIIRRITGKDLVECHKDLQRQAAYATMQKRQQLNGTGQYVSNNICKQIAYPYITQYPLYFIFDWITEVIKTTLDLYSYQLIPMITNTYFYDPIEEYLPEKISACLYTQTMPIWMRLICWLEFISSILIWIGLFGGLWIFVIIPLARKDMKNKFLKIWLTLIPTIGIIVGMTGGFGYARLRLPAEPLILILSFTFWLTILRKLK
jgi:hypothetical protein